MRTNANREAIAGQGSSPHLCKKHSQSPISRQQQKQPSFNPLEKTVKKSQHINFHYEKGTPVLSSGGTVQSSCFYSKATASQPQHQQQQASVLQREGLQGHQQQLQHANIYNINQEQLRVEIWQRESEIKLLSQMDYLIDLIKSLDKDQQHAKQIQEIDNLNQSYHSIREQQQQKQKRRQSEQPANSKQSDFQKEVVEQINLLKSAFQQQFQPKSLQENQKGCENQKSNVGDLEGEFSIPLQISGLSHQRKSHEELIAPLQSQDVLPDDQNGHPEAEQQSMEQLKQLLLNKDEQLTQLQTENCQLQKKLNELSELSDKGNSAGNSAGISAGNEVNEMYHQKMLDLANIEQQIEQQMAVIEDLKSNNQALMNERQVVQDENLLMREQIVGLGKEYKQVEVNMQQLEKIIQVQKQENQSMKVQIQQMQNNRKFKSNINKEGLTKIHDDIWLLIQKLYQRNGNEEIQQGQALEDLQIQFDHLWDSGQEQLSSSIVQKSHHDLSQPDDGNIEEQQSNLQQQQQEEEPQEPTSAQFIQAIPPQEISFSQLDNQQPQKQTNEDESIIEKKQDNIFQITNSVELPPEDRIVDHQHSHFADDKKSNEKQCQSREQQQPLSQEVEDCFPQIRLNESQYNNQDKVVDTNAFSSENIKELQEQNLTMQKELNLMKQELQNLKNTNDILKEEKIQFKQKALDLENQIAVQSYLGQIVDLAELEHVKQQNLEMVSAKEDQLDYIREIYDKNEEKIQQLKQLQLTVDEDKLSLEQQRKNLEQQSFDLEKDKQSLNEQKLLVEQQKLQMEELIKNVEEEKLKNEQQAGTLLTQKQDLEITLQGLQVSQKNLQNEQNALLSEKKCLEQERELLQSQIQQLQKDIQQNANEKKGLEEMAEQIQAQKDGIQTEKQALEIEKQQLLQARTGFDNDRLAFEKDQETLGKEYINQIDNLSTQVKQMELDLAEKDNLMQAALQESEQRTASQAEQAAESIQQLQAANDEEKKRLLLQIADLNESNVNLQSEVYSLNQQVDELKSLLQEKQDELSKLELQQQQFQRHQQEAPFIIKKHKQQDSGLIEDISQNEQQQSQSQCTTKEQRFEDVQVEICEGGNQSGNSNFGLSSFSIKKLKLDLEIDHDDEVSNQQQMMQQSGEPQDYSMSREKSQQEDEQSGSILDQNCEQCMQEHHQRQIQKDQLLQQNQQYNFIRRQPQPQEQQPLMKNAPRSQLTDINDKLQIKRQAPVVLPNTEISSMQQEIRNLQKIFEQKCKEAEAWKQTYQKINFFHNQN